MQIPRVSCGALRCLAAGVLLLALTLPDLASGGRRRGTDPPEELPPDPISVATPLDPTAMNDFADSVAFLYTGSDPIQTGVDPADIDPARAAVLRGRVLRPNGNPFAGVEVSVVGHPELGMTLTRADGLFDLVANGGGLLTLRFVEDGFLPAERTVEVPVRTSVFAPDVELVRLDATTTAVTLDPASPQPMQVARGSMESDADGARQATVLFPSGVTPTFVGGSGAPPPATLTIRATEYTVGMTGPRRMPAALPPTSGYTYAVELTADEAVADGATSVTFSTPLPFYLENFLGFAVGTPVPAGSYDRTQSLWVPEETGVVLEIVGTAAGGEAELDSDGDGLADDAATLAALGITAEEQATIAGLYPVGQTLWRFRVSHFTPWDANMNLWPPADGAFPMAQVDGGDPGDGAPPDSCDEPPVEMPGSVIEVEPQCLGESIPIAGTPYRLHYKSARVPGYQAARSLELQLSGPSVPASLKRIDLEVQVAGTRFAQSFPPDPDQTFTYTWDGVDAYARPVTGGRPARARIDYVYDGVYQEVSRFGYNAGGALTGIPGRGEVALSQEVVRTLDGFDVTGKGLGGWELGVHHGYDPVARVIYRGDGRRESAQLVDTIEPVAGTTFGYAGDGGPATQAQLRAPRGLAFGPDGSLYLADSGNARIRRIRPDGIIELVAGNGAACFPGTCPGAPDYGAGGPAVDAPLDVPLDVAVEPDGSVIIAAWRERRLRRVDPAGIITNLFNLDLTEPGNAGSVGRARDGTLYYALTADSFNDRQVMRLDPDGTRLVVAGNHLQGSSGDGGPAIDATITPASLAVGPDGSLYVADGDNHVVRRIPPDGRIQTVAGTGSPGFGGDGGPATQAQLQLAGQPVGQSAVAVAPDGTLYLADTHNHRIRRVSPDGIITTVAGTGTAGLAGDGGLALRAELDSPEGVAIAADGSVLVADTGNHRIRRIRPPLPDFLAGAVVLPSGDGRELYAFDAQGRHLETRDALTGVVLLSFGYDPAGRLVTITDRAGLVTTIERDPATGDPEAIVAPFGQRTLLGLNGPGWLETVTDPEGGTYTLLYHAGALLRELQNPRGHATTFTYDALGRLEREDDPVLGFQMLDRTTTAAGAPVVTHTTALGRGTQVTTEPTPLGGRRRTVLELATGLTSERVAGSEGITTRTSPDGMVHTRQAAPDPRFGMQAPLVSETLATPLGRTRTVTHDRVVTLDPGTGALLTQTDTASVNGRPTTVFYDATLAEIVTTSPERRERVELLDALGRVAEVDPDGAGPLHPIRLGYDPAGRLETIAQGSAPGVPDERVTTFGHDPVDGYLVSITDPEMQATTLVPDALGRVRQIVRPDGETIGIDYDPNGNVTSLTPPGQPAHTFTHTPVDREATYTPPAVGPFDPTTTTDHDLDREVDLVTRPDGGLVDPAYDAAGRLDTLTLTPGGVYDLAYDPLTGSLEAITTPAADALSFGYDGALVTSTTWSGAVSGSVQVDFDDDLRVATRTVNGADPVGFDYDGDSLLDTVTLPGGEVLSIARHIDHGLVEGVSLGIVSTTIDYDGFGERELDQAFAGATLLYQNDYLLRDRLGRIRTKVETIQGVTTTTEYTYDPAGRLDTVTVDGQLVRDYEYDPNGNRLRELPGGPVIASFDAQDRLLSRGTVTYAYNEHGDLETRTDTTTGEVTNYGYDLLGSLKTVDLPDGRQITYVVDGLGRRVGKRVDGVLTKGWLYADALNPVAELDDAGTVVSRFVYGSRAHVPDAMVQNGTVYAILSDHLGSVRLVVDTTTGDVMQRLDYDEWGNVTGDTNAGFQPFGFAGGLYDPDTKLVRFGARDYDPEVGRWTAKDPIRFEGSDTDLYLYVAGDPVNAVDPSGLFLASGLRTLARGLGQTPQEFSLGGRAASGLAGGAATLLGFTLPPSARCQGLGGPFTLGNLLDLLALQGASSQLFFAGGLASNAGGLSTAVGAAGLGTSAGVGSLALLGGFGIGSFVNNQVLDRLPGGNPVLNLFLNLGGVD